MNFWRRAKRAPDTTFDLAGSLAIWILQALKLVGAKTYVEITATHPAEGELTFEVMRMSGESHGTRAARYERIIRSYVTARPRHEWQAAMGCVVWWQFDEHGRPVGTPFCGLGWDAATHFTRIPEASLNWKPKDEKWQK